MVDIARQYPGQLTKPAAHPHASLRRFVRDRRAGLGLRGDRIKETGNSWNKKGKAPSKK